MQPFTAPHAITHPSPEQPVLQQPYSHNDKVYLAEVGLLTPGKTPAQDFLYTAIKTKDDECRALIAHDPKTNKVLLEGVQPPTKDPDLTAVAANWLAACENVQSLTAIGPVLGWETYATAMLDQGKEFRAPAIQDRVDRFMEERARQRKGRETADNSLVTPLPLPRSLQTPNIGVDLSGLNQERTRE
jgi:hypothetical protein